MVLVSRCIFERLGFTSIVAKCGNVSVLTLSRLKAKHLHLVLVWIFISFASWESFSLFSFFYAKQTWMIFFSYSFFIPFRTTTFPCFHFVKVGFKWLENYIWMAACATVIGDGLVSISRKCKSLGLVSVLDLKVSLTFLFQFVWVFKAVPLYHRQFLLAILWAYCLFCCECSCLELSVETVNVISIVTTNII